jgi:uncharacterized protein YsxB (DUF464 family)
MIKARYIEQSGKFISLKVTGHALADIPGKDLVCAGVSAIITGGINALKNPKSFQLTIKKGLAEIVAINEIELTDQIVLSTIKTQLVTMAESYKEYVQISYERK